MKKLDPNKVFVQYRGMIVTPYDPVNERKYTITHSDKTAELFVFVGNEYATDQATKMRDDVRIQWVKTKFGLALAGVVIVDGEGVIGNAAMRNRIFLKEMPTALQALRQADRFLFKQRPALDKANVYIKFASTLPAFDRTYSFGEIGFYR